MPAEVATSGSPVHAAEASPLLAVVEVGLSAGGRAVLDGVDLLVTGGRTTVIMGPNGAGKTTLLRIMMGLEQPGRGRVTPSSRADGTPIRLAFVFQRPVMLKRSVADNVAFARRAAGLAADRGTIDRILGEVGLENSASSPARRLSGGEQQRLALARALAREPDLLLLDEPTASLDPAQTRAVEEIIARVATAGVTVVMSTHNPGQARRLADDVVLMVRGRIAEHTAAARFFDTPRTGEARRFLAGELVL